ncbi:MAG: hypothetical protein AVDCRST_MAG77-4501 [uncultured Chloroflexi bacterium]|uniref:Glycoside hydrolase family 5 domain-containing protein n=1 Tax=uncultured Chloroflexota bacterium TaxID=166587 RepID=A0A6J4JVU7_9CHLR|nr:MAG: hypothetical protein AVDCRST_MAG77-4501 [uncultured Chloroflexota bacterium]
MPETNVAIDGARWVINGKPTYRGQTFRSQTVEGLLFNARMVQATFDDENALTRPLWAYPDTGAWDAERNTAECTAAMPSWRAHGLAAITVCLQGGRAVGYRSHDPDALLLRFRERGVSASDEAIWAGLEGSIVDQLGLDRRRSQPWHNSAFTAEGELKPAYFGRLARVLDAADGLGMVVIVSLFYQGQDERLRDEAAIRRAVEGACGWVLDRGYTNVVIEINNECNVSSYEHAILQPGRVQELIELAKGVTKNGRRLLAGTSYAGMRSPDDEVAAVSDLLTMHGNGAQDPDQIAQLVAQARALPSYQRRPMPVVFNEDYHFRFEQPRNNFLAAVESYAGWGYYDPGKTVDGHQVVDRYWHSNYEDGYQMVPVNWTINTPWKQGFFRLLKEITGGTGA